MYIYLCTYTCHMSYISPYNPYPCICAPMHGIPHFEVDLPIHDHGHPASSTTGWVFFGLKNEGLLSLATKRFNLFLASYRKVTGSCHTLLGATSSNEKNMYTQINAGKRIFACRIWHFFQEASRFGCCARYTWHILLPEGFRKSS